MTRNVGKIDKILRIIAGIIIIAFGIIAKTWWGAIGLIPLTTGLVNWCPAYIPLGINTCGTKTKPEKK